MSQPTASQTVQRLLADEQALLARKATLTEQVGTVDADLVRVRAALQGVQLGRLLAAETLEAEA